MTERMAHLAGVVSGPRAGQVRSRRGRGARGPVALPGPLSETSVPIHRTPREAFDLLVSDLLNLLDKHFTAEPIEVDVVVEDVPLLAANWDQPIPHGSVVSAANVQQVVLYRVPITRRCNSEAQVEDLVLTVLVSHLAEIWGLSPEDIDPRA